MPNHISPSNLQKFWNKIRTWMYENFHTKDDVYNRNEVDAKLDEKFDSLSLYSKADIDAKLGEKVNSSDAYTKSDVDTRMSNIYSKSEVDNRLASKVSIPSLSTSDANVPIGTYILGKKNTISGNTTSLWESNSGRIFSDTQPTNYTQCSGVWAIRGGQADDIVLGQRIS